MSVITTPRTDRPGWAIAKSVGDTAERMVADLLIGIGATVKNVNQPGHDLEVIGKIEVKHDLRAAHTGNLAIEVEYKGRPSGLSTTTADTWAIVVGPRLILISTTALRKLILNRRTYAGGEHATIVLILISEAEQVGIVQPFRK